MEKKLLRILLLIPILLIFIPIKNVYAEERYVNFTNMNFSPMWFETTTRENYNNIETYNFFNNNYNFNSYKSKRFNFLVFKHKELELYSVIVLSYNQNYLYYNFDTTSNRFQFYNGTDIYSSNASFRNLFIYEDVSVFNNFINTLTFSPKTNNYSYLNGDSESGISIHILGYDTGSTQGNNSFILSEFLQYFNYIGGTNDLYIDKELLNVYIPPEPEPEEPTIPPFNFNNNKYYVPNYHTGQCVEVLDKDTIRVFEDEFTDFYTDYYINSNYISKTGQVDIDYEKKCSSLEFTDIRYYGNDLPQILFILICVLTFTIGFPYVLYKRFRKR